MQEALTFTDLEWSILQTVAYADIFDYPLTAEEIQRYLIGKTASLEQVDAVLSQEKLSTHFLFEHDGYFTLAGREKIINIRRHRSHAARLIWPIALHYGQLIGNLPFVRMVAVTGSLAVDNVEPGSDIDFLIVTQPGRLWLCRLFVIALVKLAERRGHTLCPNYFISENALIIRDRNLFAARELAQMVPITGLETYNTMRHLNQWTEDFLPNANGHVHAQTPPAETINFNKRMTERILQTQLGSWIDSWEMRRKIRKLTRHSQKQHEADFSPDWCKGHFDGHMERILDAFNQRLHTLKHNHRQYTSAEKLKETV